MNSKSSLCSIIVSLLVFTAFGQANTEVYLFDLDMNGDKPILSNPKNISNNDGYDNQPSFLDDNTVLFSSTREEQTDILKFNITEGSTSSWLTDTPTGSEYSPLKIPGKNAVSAIRLDLDGLQRLYEYDLETGEPKLLLEDLKVGYHAWYNEHVIVCTVLVDNRMDLVVCNLKDGTNFTFQKNVGRSLQKIPNSELMSFISKESEVWEIKSMNPISGETKKIASSYGNSEDICWLSDNSILTAAQKTILRLQPNESEDWQPLIKFELGQIDNISRIAVNEKATRLAFVAEESPLNIVQRQVDTFNKRDLDGFLACYADNVVVRRFPDDTMYVGKTKMRDSYERFYANTKEAKVDVINRITIGTKVIDEETSLVDGRENQQVAIYEVSGGFITSMTFIFQVWETEDAESIIEKQLDAYNARDIDAFMETYSADVELYNFPNELTTKGKEAMRKGYEGFFESTPDLNCAIKNRIVIGNKVIDEEFITANGSNFSAVAIYEVENGKIAKVTFLR